MRPGEAYLGEDEGHWGKTGKGPDIIILSISGSEALRKAIEGLIVPRSRHVRLWGDGSAHGNTWMDFWLHLQYITVTICAERLSAQSNHQTKALHRRKTRLNP